MKQLFRSRSAYPAFATGPGAIVGPSDMPGGIVGPSDRPGVRSLRATAPGGTPDAMSASLTTPMDGAITGSQLLGVGGSALYGGAIGGVAAHSWAGATTGALAGGTIAALSYGGMNLMMGRYLMGGILLAAGGFGGYMTYKRWRKRR